MGGFVDSQKLTEVTFGRRHRAELCRTPETASIFHFVLQCYPLIQCRSAAPPMPHWTAVHRPPEGASPGVREVNHNHCLTVDVCTELRIAKRTDLCEFGDAWSQSLPETRPLGPWHGMGLGLMSSRQCLPACQHPFSPKPPVYTDPSLLSILALAKTKTL